jgi:hypothetical protein
LIISKKAIKYATAVKSANFADGKTGQAYSAGLFFARKSGVNLFGGNFDLCLSRGKQRGGRSEVAIIRLYDEKVAYIYRRQYFSRVSCIFFVKPGKQMQGVVFHCCGTRGDRICSEVPLLLTFWRRCSEKDVITFWLC